MGSELHVEGVDSDSPKRVRAELGSELRVEGVGSEVVDKVDEDMESSDERFGAVSYTHLTLPTIYSV